MPKRWNSLDALKGIACLAVVLIHYNLPGDPGVIIKTVCRFAVPVFFCISGFFLVGEKPLTDERVVGKLRHVLGILLGAGIFYALFTPLWYSLAQPGWDMLGFAYERMRAGKLVKLVISNDPLVYAHLWFLMALAYCYVFTLLVFPRGRGLKAAGVLGLVLLTLYSLMQEFGGVLGIPVSVGIPGVEERVMIYNIFLFRALPFFLLGTALRRRQAWAENLRVPTWVLLALIPAGCVLAVVERFALRESQFFLGSYVTVAAMFLLALRYPNGGGKVLSYVGRELSMYVYILHIAVGKMFDLLASTFSLWQNPWFVYSRALLVMAGALLSALLLVQLKHWRRSKVKVQGA